MNNAHRALFSRRNFLRYNAAGMAALPLMNGIDTAHAAEDVSQVVVVRTQDRRHGVSAVLDALPVKKPEGRRVVIKPNFNTADATPGSTHNDTLMQLITDIRARGGEDITIGESSGPPATASVFQQKGIPQLASDMKIKTVNFEELGADEWVHFNPEGNHWPEGFSLPRMVTDAEYFVSTCCLKTHGFGGVYTMSMKLAVGLTPKPIRGGMHALSNTHMRRMIAELNLGYKPDVIVMDGIEVFTDGGPMSGTLKQAGVFIGGTDRIAVDAVGLAVLKNLGANEAIMGRNIFEQEQIVRAVELGLGVTSPGRIEIVAPVIGDREYAERLSELLLSEA